MDGASGNPGLQKWRAATGAGRYDVAGRLWLVFLCPYQEVCKTGLEDVGEDWRFGDGWCCGAIAKRLLPRWKG